MKRLTICMLVLLMALGVASMALAEEKAMVVHFVVVPSDSPGVNYATEVPELQKMLTRLAGGYTAMGATHGGSAKDTGLTAEQNMSYMVAAKKNVAAEISTYVTEHFKEEPFILVWNAQRYSQDK
ncbi:MAG: hypothetical protein KKC99_08350 [Proteobacteria bacterium]|nr:hypothetical protein [Pseudomonadota bacterium]